MNRTPAELAALMNQAEDAVHAATVSAGVSFLIIVYVCVVAAVFCALGSGA